MVEPLIIPENRASFGKVIHLFETMRRYGVNCLAELESDGLHQRTSGSVKVTYTKDTLTVFVGNTESSFDVSCELSAKVSGHHIYIGITDCDHGVTFDSGIMPDEVMEMARLYDDTTDQVGDVKLKITSSEPFASTNYLDKLLLGGRVIKDTQVLGSGEQVLTVGYVD